MLLWQSLATEAAYGPGPGLARDILQKPSQIQSCLPWLLDLQDSLGHMWFHVASLGSELQILHRRHSVAAHSLLRILHCVTSGNLNYCTSVSLDKTLARCLLSRPVLTSPTPVVLQGHLRAFTRTSALHGFFLGHVLSAPRSCHKDPCKGEQPCSPPKTRSGPHPTCKNHTAPINCRFCSPLLFGLINLPKVSHFKNGYNI